MTLHCSVFAIILNMFFLRRGTLKDKYFNMYPNPCKIKLLFMFQLNILNLLNNFNSLLFSFKLWHGIRNQIISAYFMSKKCKLERKRSQKAYRKLLRNPQSIWVAHGRTEEWW